MADKAWKRHERTVARYFGVERIVRGADFSQIGCEVVAPLSAWRAVANNIPTSHRYEGVVVECKQGYSSKPVELFRGIHNRNKTKSRTLMVWGEYAFSWMDDKSEPRAFDFVWNELIDGSLEVGEFIKRYHVESIHHQVPRYIEDFVAQSEEYIPVAVRILDGRIKPLVALHANGLQGRLIVWRL